MMYAYELSLDCLCKLLRLNNNWNTNVLEVKLLLDYNSAFRNMSCTPVPWVPDYKRWLYRGHRGITAENIEKLEHTDFNEDTTNESTSVACSNIRL